MMGGYSTPQYGHMDQVLLGFLTLVHEAPTFLDKYKAHIDDLDTQYTAKKAQLDSIASTLADRLVQMEGEVDAARQTKLSTVDAEANALRSKHSDISASVEDLENQHRFLLKQLNDTKADIEAQKQLSAQLIYEREQNLAAVQAQIGIASAALAGVQQTHSELQSSIKALLAKYGT